MDELSLKPSLLVRQKRRDKRLHEEVIECRRSNGGDSNKKSREKGGRKAIQRIKDVEDYPVHESIRSIAKYNTRTSPSDNLEPLKRWLGSQVGRPWSEVYADLGKIARPDSMHGLHIREHLWDFVLKNAWLDAYGGIVVANKWGYLIYPTKNKGNSWFQSRFFVNPVHGKLQRLSDLNQASNATGPSPKKARFKTEKAKNRWKTKQDILPEWMRLPGCDLNGFAQIRTRSKRIAPGKMLDIRDAQSVYRVKVENVRLYNGLIRNKVAKHAELMEIQIAEIHFQVIDVHLGTAPETGQMHRTIIYKHELNSWTAFDAHRLF